MVVETHPHARGDLGVAERENGAHGGGASFQEQRHHVQRRGTRSEGSEDREGRQTLRRHRHGGGEAGDEG